MASGDSDTDPTASTLVTRISSVSGMREELHSALAQANLGSGTGGTGGSGTGSEGSSPPASPAFPIANSIGRFARGLYEGAYTQEE